MTRHRHQKTNTTYTTYFDDVETAAALADLQRRVAALEDGAPPEPDPSPAPAAGAYGTIAADSKANLEIGPWGDIAHRWRAPVSSTPQIVTWSQRWGSGGYSGGTGGSIVVSIYPDVDGKPGGLAIAATAAYAKGNPGAQTKFDTQPFIGAKAVTKGDLYWTVYHNADPSPLANWISVNDLWARDNIDPRSPEQPDLAVFQNGPNWRLADPGYTPVEDIAFTDGSHVGQGFIEAMVAQFAVIGGLNTIRERFTPTEDRGPFTEIGLRCRRITGTSALTVSLAGVGGAASAVPLDTTADGLHRATGWAIAKVPEFSLKAGQAYELRASAPAGTAYETVPLRQGTNFGLNSRAFQEGAAEKSIDGGQTWVPPYPDQLFAPNDWQWFAR